MMIIDLYFENFYLEIMRYSLRLIDIFNFIKRKVIMVKMVLIYLCYKSICIIVLK